VMVTVREMAWMAMWGIETKCGDRNDAQYSVEKGHLYVLRPLFDLCFVLLASALATLYVSLCGFWRLNAQQHASPLRDGQTHRDFWPASLRS
jgi:hypothetical protein